MSITAVVAPTAFKPTGNIDTTNAGTGSPVPMPPSLGVGDRVVVPIFYAQATGTGGQGTPPTGWSIVNPAQGTASNRMLLAYEYKITDATALAALPSTVTFRSGSAATRVVGRAVQVSGTDLTKPLVVGALEFSATGSTGFTVSQPGSGDKVLVFVGSNSSAPTPNAVMGSTGGTKLSQDQALSAASGSVADSQLGIFDGATAITFSASVPNHVSWAIGFPQYVAPSTALKGIQRDPAGVNHQGELFYFTGSAKKDVTFRAARYKPVTVSDVLNSPPWFGQHRGSSYSYNEESMRGYRASAGQGAKVLEVSVWQATDAVGSGGPKFICSHDQNLSRVTGTSLDIPTNPASAALALSSKGTTAAGNPTQPTAPIIELRTLLDEFSDTHVIIIECKQGSPAKQNLIDFLMANYNTPERPARERFIWKADALGNKTAFFDPAIAVGWHRWAYIFNADMASSFAALAASGKADMIGMDYNSSDATLLAAIDVCRQYGIQPSAHIVPSVAQRDRLLALGMQGMMISNILALPAYH